MNKKSNKRLANAGILLLIAIGMMTWAERVEKSQNLILKWNFFIVFGGFFFGALALFIVWAVKAGKHVKEEDDPPMTGEARVILCREAALWCLALLLPVGLCVLGSRVLPAQYELLFFFIALTLTAGLILFAVLTYVRLRLYTKSVNDMGVRERQEFLLSHRDEAEKTAAEKKALLLRLIRCTDGVSVAVALVGALTALLFGGTGGVFLRFAAPVMVFCACALMTAFSRIRFPVPQAAFRENNWIISEEDAPRLYGNARRAMKTMGVDRRLYIIVTPGNEAGVSTYGDVCELTLGAELINLFSEKEMYCVLLHEFRHTAAEKKDKIRLREYAGRCNGGSMLLPTAWMKRCLVFYDAKYMYENLLYNYADTLSEEASADAASAKYGDPQAAASALLKTLYLRLSEWEDGSFDKPCVWEPESADRAYVQENLQFFGERLALRESVWHEIYGKEILARNASHPTERMRCEAMGVPEPVRLPADHDPEYAAEVDRATAFAEKRMADNLRDSYEARRKAFYLEPLERLQKWEADGKLVSLETCPEIAGDLRSLGRVEEALAVCDRAIASVETADRAHYAMFIKGRILLQRFDPEGAEYLWKAIMQNSNYIDEGLNALGEFYCYMGMQKELDEYRERAIVKAEEQEAKFDKMSELLPTDDLSTEHLPAGEITRLRNALDKLEPSVLTEVLVVHKQITEDFSCSPVILHFGVGTADEIRGEILHKVFLLLDNSGEDWQYSLFDYDDLPKLKAKLAAIEGTVLWRPKNE